jgi:ATP-dependent helicase/nuclease subunit A
MTRAKEHLILVGTCRNDQVEKWTATWSNHLGALPAATVLAARTPLDWFGPVAAAAGEAAIAVTMHTEGNGEPEAAASADEASDAAAERLRPLARLQALDPPPTVSPAAREAMDRLCRVYEYHELTGKAAAISVTNLAKPASARSSFTAAGDGSAGSVSPVDEILPQPTFFAGLRPLNAADRGTATHVVLQHLDFTKAADRSAIVMQVQRMLRDRRVTEQQAEAVDIEAIHWLLQQEVGRLLRERGNELMREVPVTFLQPPPVAAAGDPRDLAMVRGRIDVLVPTGGELVIVDYKTDRVEGEALEQRTEAYRGQLALYREAIERISRRKVSRAVLVFLQARQWRDV